MYKYLIALFLTLSILTGCQYGRSGGNSGIMYESIREVVTPEGEVLRHTKRLEVDNEQPDSAETSAIIDFIENDDGITVSTNTGKSYDIESIVARAQLLNIPIYFGMGLVGIGLIIFLITKKLDWAIVIGGTGIGIAAGAYLLDRYAIYFLFLVLAIIGYAGYRLIEFRREYLRQRQANRENVKIVQTAKKMGIVDGEKFGAIAQELQSPETKQIVKSIKG